MEHPAITILNAHRMMAVSTVRPDGWPQTTIVGYANRGFDIYFVVLRSSQKLANIRHEPRISLAVASEPHRLEEVQAVYAGALASEVTDAAEAESAWSVLTERHRNLAGLSRTDASDSVLIRASCKHVSIVDFTQGVGHKEVWSAADA